MKRAVAIGMAGIVLVAVVWSLFPSHARFVRSFPPADIHAAGDPSATFPAAVDELSQPLPKQLPLQLLAEQRRVVPREQRSGPGKTRLPQNSQHPTRQSWGRELLESLQKAVPGELIRFELLGGKMASGQIEQLEQLDGEVKYVSGRLTQPEPGRFFFQNQTVPGVAGEFAGVVEFPASKLSFRLEPTGPGGQSELVERTLAQVKCFDLPLAPSGRGPKTEEIPPLNPAEFPAVPIPGYQKGVVLLQSLPGAQPVIYLDFQGGYTPAWGGIQYERANFANAEIRETWQRVAEDFISLNINVTTDLKTFQNASPASRQRVIITPTDTAQPGVGGAAYEGSFNWSTDTPCWVFQLGTPKYCAQACSHEAGHTLGLSHEGEIVNGQTNEYFFGHGGTGETGWAPIMGVGYNDNVTQWSKGEYLNANNTEDQLAILVSKNNNVQYRVDDTGDTLATSRYLEVYPDYTASAEGLIETTGDTDAFQFTTRGGLVSLTATPVIAGPNLAIKAALYDSSDALLASNDPQTTLSASIRTNLPPGTYTFRVAGSARNDPLTNGFSAYGSLGYYSITGSVANARLPDRFVIPEHTPTGAVVGLISANNPDGDPLTYTITSGNLGNTFAIDGAGNLSVADGSLLNYETLAGFLNSQFPVEFQMLADVTNSVHPALSEADRRIVVVITNVFEPPTLTGFTASVAEHSQPGTLLGVALGASTDFYSLLTYAIVSGNSNNVFSIDAQNGLVTVAGDLTAAIQNLYQLTVTLADQTEAGVLMATSLVTINVDLPYPGGGISYAVYTNLAGTSVADLTSASSFPHDAAYERQVPLFEGESNRESASGAVLRGYLLPPKTGSYTFWMASQADSELWLSTSTNTTDALRIASVNGDGVWPGPRQWTGWPGQQSAPISLAAGHAYYIEARLKASSVTNHISVAWECAENGITQDVIPGHYLSPYFINYVPHPQGFTNYIHEDAIAGACLGTVSVRDLNRGDQKSFTFLAGNDAGLFSIDPSGRIFLLSDIGSRADPTTNYFFKVQATDNGIPPLSGTSTVALFVVPTNAIIAKGIQQEIWTNIGSDTAIGSLYGPRFPKRPDLLRTLTGFDSGGQSLGTNYGSRIQAVLVPTNSGLYTFFVASSDSSQLLLSLTGNPADAAIVASIDGRTARQEWTRYASQQSTAVSLVARQHYYLETRHKAASGEDHVEVGWTAIGLPGTNIIDQEFLMPVDINFAPDLIDYRSVQLPLSATNGTLVATISPTDSLLDTLAYGIVSGDLGGAFAIDPPTGRLTVADRTAFATYSLTDFSLMVEVQDSGYGGLFPLKSTQAEIRVQIVDDTAALNWTGGGDTKYWSAAGNWGGKAPIDNSKLTFTGNQRLTNYNDSIQQAGLVTLSNGGFLLNGNPLLLTEGMASAGDNTWAIKTTLAGDQTFTNYFGTLTLAGQINNNGFQLGLNVMDTVLLSGTVTGAGGLTKSGYGNLVLSASNQYTGLTYIGSGTLTVSNANALIETSDMTVGQGANLDVRAVPGGFIVQEGQTLEGDGRVLGPVTVKGTIGPQFGFGTLNFSDNLVLAGTTLVALGGEIQVDGELNCGGDLNVEYHIFGFPLPPGSRFKLFNAARITGSFRTITLPWPGYGLEWDTNLLASQGVITVTAPRPQILPVTLTSGTTAIQFETWQGLTYQLQAAASLRSPLSWVHVATILGSNSFLYQTNFYFSTNNGVIVTNSILSFSDGPSSVAVPLIQTNPQQFFRLRVY